MLGRTEAELKGDLRHAGIGASQGVLGGFKTQCTMKSMRTLAHLPFKLGREVGPRVMHRFSDLLQTYFPVTVLVHEVNRALNRKGTRRV